MYIQYYNFRKTNVEILTTTVNVSPEKVSKERKQDPLSRPQPKIEYFYDFLFIITVAFGTYLRFQYVFIERLWPDEALYAWCGQRIFSHPSLLFSKEIIEFHPPLFSLLLALGHFFLPSEEACRSVSIILNLIGIIAIYRLGIQISNRFLGLFCAVTLTFNYLYFISATHILIDGPLCVFLIFLLLVLNKAVEDQRACRYDVSIGLIGSAMVLLKWSGTLVIPFLGICYLLAFQEIAWTQRLRKAATSLGIILFTTLLLLINNQIQLGRFLPDISALQGLYFIKSMGYYTANLNSIVSIPSLLPFFLYGIFIAFMKKEHRYSLLWICFLIFFAAISITPEKDLRYSAIILPSILIITGLGLMESLKRLFIDQRRIILAQIVSLGFIFIFCGQTYLSTKVYLQKHINAYVGFKEAGLWVKGHVTEETLVVASSARAIRYYSNINFREFGGNLSQLPANKDEFERIVIDTKAPILLVLDRWEWTQPEWIYPLDEEKMKYLENLGFHLEKMVVKKAATSKGLSDDIPVAWLLTRMPTGNINE